jgi:EmrB/QacA subfamily drug resistance transporter
MENEKQISHRNDNFLILSLMIGVLMGAIDSTIVLLALPTINEYFNTQLSLSIWVILIYLLVIAVGTTQLGRLGDILTRKRIFVAGLAVFTIGSALCGASVTIYELIGFRALQGVGAAMIQSNSGAIVADNFPPQRRGRVFGFTSIGYNSGAMLGIVLGGAITTFIGWQYIFYINVPIGIFAIIFGLKYIRSGNKVENKLDIPGTILLASALSLISYGGVNVTSSGLDMYNEFFILIGVIVLFSFILVERVVDKPLIPFRIFKIKVLSFSICAAFLQSLGFLSVVFLLIMYLQGIRDKTPFDSSLYLLPGYIVGSVLGPLFGRLADRIGSRIPATLGLLVMGFAIIIYSSLNLNTSLNVIIVGSFFTGIGSSLFYPANNSAVMANSPRDLYGLASGFLRTMSNIGMLGSFIIAISIASLSIPRNVAFEVFAGISNINGGLTLKVSTSLLSGIRSALYVSLAILLIGALLSFARGKENRSNMKVDNEQKKVDK